MSSFYGIEPGALPAFATEDGEHYVPIGNLPDETIERIGVLTEHFRDLHAEDPLAFTTVVGMVAASMKM